MRHLFVPYEIALKLKEKGFDEPCLAEYIDDEVFTLHRQFINEHPTKDESFITHTNTKPNWIKEHFKCSAPLYQQVIDWLREKHNEVILIIPDKSRTYWDYMLTSMQDKGWMMSTNNLKEYYKTLDKAIIQALEFIKT